MTVLLASGLPLISVVAAINGQFPGAHPHLRYVSSTKEAFLTHRQAQESAGWGHYDTGAALNINAPASCLSGGRF